MSASRNSLVPSAALDRGAPADDPGDAPGAHSAVSSGRMIRVGVAATGGEGQHRDIVGLLAGILGVVRVERGGGDDWPSA